MNLYGEVYSVDINKRGDLVVFGGNTDKFVVGEFPTTRIIAEVSDFQDSVIFVKFVLDDIIICATLDGIISLHVIEENEIKEITNRDLEEDISFIDYCDGCLMIGTEKGSVHLFNDNLEDELFFLGHNADIKHMKVQFGKLYTLSSNKYIIFDIETQELLVKRVLPDFVTFEPVENNMSLISRVDQTILVKDNDIVLQRYNFGAESIIKIDNDLICGGSGFSLNIVNLKDTKNCYNFKFIAENIEGISKIIDLGANIIALSTFCGKIAIGDFRDGKSFKFYETNVGIIYDFKFFQKFIAVCGSEGIKVIHL